MKKNKRTLWRPWRKPDYTDQAPAITKYEQALQVVREHEAQQEAAKNECWQKIFAIAESYGYAISIDHQPIQISATLVPLQQKDAQ